MNIVLEESTPQNAPLAAKYKKSFAYPSMKDRCPVIITKIADYLCRDKQTIIDCYGEGVEEEIKTTIGEISQLKNQLQTGKPFEEFCSPDPDSGIWNSHLKELQEKGVPLNYYETDWLFAECYLYRKIREIFATKKCLHTLDPFSAQKNLLLKESLPALCPLLHHLEDRGVPDSSVVMNVMEAKEEIFQLFKCALWANRLDLSLSGGSSCVQNDILREVEKWNDNIIVNDLEKLYSTILSDNNNCDKTIEYVMDNSGMEALCDFCLADGLITRFGIKRINFRVKPIPWYVSDVMIRDFHHSIDSVMCYPDPVFQKFGKRWKKYLESGVWTVTSDVYWCLGLGYSAMQETDTELYSILSRASLVIFKGDLNYRKLLQDMNWEPTTPFAVALGDFHPAPLVTIRTCKADLICGLEKGVAEALSAKHSTTWMTSGDFAVIQFYSP